MSKSIYIYGASGHGLVVADIARACGYDDIIFVDDGENNYPSFDDIQRTSDIPMAFGIGNNTIRAKLFEKVKKSCFEIVSLVHPTAIISPSVIIGRGTVVMPNVVVNSKATIGDGVILNTSCVVEHECVIENFVHISPKVALAGDVKVSEFTHIGIGSNVIQGIIIRNNTVIGAGSTVVKNIDKFKKAYGNPCREIEDIKQMNKRIFLSAPHMSKNERYYIDKVFESNYIAPLGEYVDKFEQSVKDYTGASHVLATNCGTAAIHLALKVLGIKEGDDVLASTFTFIGSVSSITYQRANPIFIDSDKASWNLSPKLLNKYLCECEKKPKALIVTHLYGQCADIEKIADICKLHGVYLIEDAAESLGATYNGKHTGTFGDFGIYSFNGNKILTTSGAGMLVSENKEWIAKAKFYATQAKENELYYQHEEIGFNYRLSNVLAAIGVGQMEVIEERVTKKREIFEWYKKYLNDVEEITFMPELENSRGNRWLTAITFEKTPYMKILKALENINVESRPLWKPMHMQPVFKDAKAIVDGTSEELFEKGLCVASSTIMTEEDVKMICDVIKENLAK